MQRLPPLNALRAFDVAAQQVQTEIGPEGSVSTVAGLSLQQRRGWQRGLNTLPFAIAVVANRTALTAYFAMSEGCYSKWGISVFGKSGNRGLSSVANQAVADSQLWQIGESRTSKKGGNIEY